MFPFMVTLAVVGFIVILCEFAVGCLDVVRGLGAWSFGGIAGIALCEWFSTGS